MDTIDRKSRESTVSESESEFFQIPNFSETPDRQHLLLILDSIDEPVYISDPQTHSLLYANEAFKRRFSVTDQMSCYRALRGMDTPCPICRNEFIFQHSPGKTFIWEFQNMSNRRWYRHIGKAIFWTDGRIVCSGMAVDITERVKAVNALEESEKVLRKRNRVIEEDLVLAQKIHSALLPKEGIKTETVSVEYRFYPLDTIGGDYFSFTKIEENGLGIFIGDVTGHGVSAALFLSLVKFTTDRLIRNYATHPGRFLTVLNEELMGQMPRSFVTAIYCLFESGIPSGTVTFSFARGGHPYPILYEAAKGKARILESEGIVIGVFDSIDTGEITLQLRKGDRVFLYTDGLVEKRLPFTRCVNEEMLIELIEKSQQSSLNSTLDKIIMEINNYYGNASSHDDIVLIGAECI